MPDRIVVMGASHGGPKALADLLRHLPVHFPLPVVLVQHIGAGKSEDFAKWLSRKVHLPVEEATEGTVLDGRRIYVAPGGSHIRIDAGGCLRLEQGDEVNSCRPSVDVLFRDAAARFGTGCIAVLLCGMGRDGAAGVGAVRAAGGVALVQDEGSSAVFGMPGAAIAQGHADFVGPPRALAEALLHWVQAGSLPRDLADTIPH